MLSPSRSISSRMVIASLILLPFFLGLSAYILDRVTLQNLRTAEEDTLLAHIYAMLGETEPETSTLTGPIGLTDPRFSTPESGLYGFIVDDNKRVIWQSESFSSTTGFATSLEKNLLIPTTSGERVFTTLQSGSHQLFSYALTTLWELETGEAIYTFVVLHETSGFDDRLAHFRQTLALWSISLGIALILIQLIIMRWGLLPLKKLSGDIQKLESGRSNLLSNGYPREIVPLTNNINLLLTSESEQRERYKNTLNDLAHSLKTPLAVVRSHLEKDTATVDQHRLLKQEIDEQVDRMSAIVQHQLKRATAEIQQTYLNRIDLATIILRIANAVKKVYHSKDIEFYHKLPNTLIYKVQKMILWSYLAISSKTHLNTQRILSK